MDTGGNCRLRNNERNHTTALAARRRTTLIPKRLGDGRCRNEIEIPVESANVYSAEIGALNLAKASLSLTSSETPASDK